MLKLRSKLSFSTTFHRVQSSNQGTPCTVEKKRVDVAFNLRHQKLVGDRKKTKKGKYHDNFFLGK
jgi:hypothetical protein